MKFFVLVGADRTIIIDEAAGFSGFISGVNLRNHSFAGVNRSAGNRYLGPGIYRQTVDQRSLKLSEATKVLRILQEANLDIEVGSRWLNIAVSRVNFASDRICHH